VTSAVRVYFVLITAIVCAAQDSRTAKPSAATRVRAMLQESCVACHNSRQAAANLKLDTFEGIAIGGASGAVVVAGRPSDSLLFQRITTSERALRMPPAGAAMPPAEIAVIKAWIEAGADGLTIGARQIVTDGDFRRDVEPVLGLSVMAATADLPRMVKIPERNEAKELASRRQRPIRFQPCAWDYEPINNVTAS